jgi:hypothetical protein
VFSRLLARPVTHTRYERWYELVYVWLVALIGEPVLGMIALFSRQVSRKR